MSRHGHVHSGSKSTSGRRRSKNSPSGKTNVIAAVEAELVEPLFVFRKGETSECIEINEDGHTLFRSTLDNLSYKTAIGSVGFSSGQHVWEFHVDRMDYRTMFFGVLVKPVDVESNNVFYSGKAWVLNANNLRICHDSRYGKEYTRSGSAAISVDDRIGVILDGDKHTLAFYVSNRNYGVAFNDLPKGETFYPCVLMSCAGQQVTLSFPRSRRAV